MSYRNRKAYHNYLIKEEYDAGLSLKGWQVKSIKSQRFDLKDAYVEINNGEAFLRQTKITPLVQNHYVVEDDNDKIKLLLKKNEILKLFHIVQERGVSLPLTELFFKNGKVKIKFGVGIGKKNYDKRQTLKDKAIEYENRNIVR